MTKLTRVALASVHCAAWIAKTTIVRLLDTPLVAIGLKMKVPTGDPIWRKSLVCDFVGHRAVVTWSPSIIVLSCKRCGRQFASARRNAPMTDDGRKELETALAKWRKDLPRRVRAMRDLLASLPENVAPTPRCDGDEDTK